MKFLNAHAMNDFIGGKVKDIWNHLGPMALVFFPIFIFSGCAQMVWYKDGASQSDFNRDRYTCMKESQQPVGVAYGNSQEFFSNSGIATNDQLFEYCMNAKGWNYQSKSSVRKYSPPVKSVSFKEDMENLKVSMGVFVRNTQSICENPEFFEISKRTKCRPKDLTPELMSMVEKLSPDMRDGFERFYQQGKDERVKLLTAFRVYGGASEKAVANALDSAEQEFDFIYSSFVAGGMSWGEYNKSIKTVNDRVASAAKLISNTRK